MSGKSSRFRSSPGRRPAADLPAPTHPLLLEFYKDAASRRSAVRAFTTLQRKWKKHLLERRMSERSKVTGVVNLSLGGLRDKIVSVDLQANSIKLTLDTREKTFTFDDVIDVDRFPGSPYTTLLPPLLDDLFAGQSSQLLCFGGKHSLPFVLGVDHIPTPAEIPALRERAGANTGVLYQAAYSILSQLHANPESRTKDAPGMAFSAYEVYNGQVFDLVTRTRLQQAEQHLGESLVVPGLSFVNIDAPSRFEDAVLLCFLHAHARAGQPRSHLFFRLSLLSNNEVELVNVLDKATARSSTSTRGPSPQDPVLEVALLPRPGLWGASGKNAVQNESHTERAVATREGQTISADLSHLRQVAATLAGAGAHKQSSRIPWTGSKLTMAMRPVLTDTRYRIVAIAHIDGRKATQRSMHSDLMSISTLRLLGSTGGAVVDAPLTKRSGSARGAESSKTAPASAKKKDKVRGSEGLDSENAKLRRQVRLLSALAGQAARPVTYIPSRREGEGERVSTTSDYDHLLTDPEVKRAVVSDRARLESVIKNLRATIEEKDRQITDLNEDLAAQSDALDSKEAAINVLNDRLAEAEDDAQYQVSSAKQQADKKLAEQARSFRERLREQEAHIESQSKNITHLQTRLQGYMSSAPSQTPQQPAAKKGGAGKENSSSASRTKSSAVDDLSSLDGLNKAELLERLKKMVGEQATRIVKLEAKLVAAGVNTPKKGAARAGTPKSIKDEIAKWRQAVIGQHDRLRNEFQQFRKSLVSTVATWEQNDRRELPESLMREVTGTKQGLSTAHSSLHEVFTSVCARLDGYESQIDEILQAGVGSGQVKVIRPSRMTEPAVASPAPEIAPVAPVRKEPTSQQADQVVKSLRHILLSCLEDHSSAFNRSVKETGSFLDHARSYLKSEPGSSDSHAVMQSMLKNFHRNLDRISKFLEAEGSGDAQGSDGGRDGSGVLSLISMSNQINVLLSDQVALANQLYLLWSEDVTKAMLQQSVDSSVLSGVSTPRSHQRTPRGAEKSVASRFAASPQGSPLARTTSTPTRTSRFSTSPKGSASPPPRPSLPREVQTHSPGRSPSSRRDGRSPGSLSDVSSMSNSGARSGEGRDWAGYDDRRTAPIQGRVAWGERPST